MGTGLPRFTIVESSRLEKVLAASASRIIHDNFVLAVILSGWWVGAKDPPPTERVS